MIRNSLYRDGSLQRGHFPQLYRLQKAAELYWMRCPFRCTIGFASFNQLSIWTIMYYRYHTRKNESPVRAALRGRSGLAPQELFLRSQSWRVVAALKQ